MGLLDKDLPCAPVLLTVNHRGQQIDAVAQGTKHGLLFVFDRVTGEPLWPIEERPVVVISAGGGKSGRRAAALWWRLRCRNENGLLASLAVSATLSGDENRSRTQLPPRVDGCSSVDSPTTRRESSAQPFEVIGHLPSSRGG